MNTDRFKFRIWHDAQGMIYPDGTFIRVSQDKIMKLDPSIEEPRYFIIPLEDYDLMQCTGLKDVSGNLIYESDLLIMSKHSDGRPCKVTWDVGCYCCFPFGTLESALPYCKIIGNIYETIQE